MQNFDYSTRDSLIDDLAAARGRIDELEAEVARLAADLRRMSGEASQVVHDTAAEIEAEVKKGK